MAFSYTTVIFFNFRFGSSSVSQEMIMIRLTSGCQTLIHAQAYLIIDKSGRASLTFYFWLFHMKVISMGAVLMEVDISLQEVTHRNLCYWRSTYT